MHPISFIFLGLCAFLLGAWLVRYWENRRLGPSNALSSTPITPAPKAVATHRPAIAPPADRPSLALDQEVQQLLAQNRKIEAIKRIREQTNWSLKQAKDYVEQGYGSTSANALPPEITAAVQQLMAENQPIAAIKLVRSHTGWGLKEAKAYVEQL